MSPIIIGIGSGVALGTGIVVKKVVEWWRTKPDLDPKEVILKRISDFHAEDSAWYEYLKKVNDKFHEGNVKEMRAIHGTLGNKMEDIRKDVLPLKKDTEVSRRLNDLERLHKGTQNYFSYLETGKV